MDPRLLDFNGNDAFKLSKGCPGVAPALSLATAVKRNLDNADRLWSSTARCAGGSRTEVVATKASSGGKIVGEERRDDGGVKHGGGVGIGRAPTAGAGIEVEIEAGKVTEQGEQGEGDLKCAGEFTSVSGSIAVWVVRKPLKQLNSCSVPVRTAQP